MLIKSTFIKDLYIFEIEKKMDERGFFARIYCDNTLSEKQLKFHLKQASTSFNKHAGTLRGMHFQADPHEETRIVRCVSGSIFDVALDLRRESKTFKKYFSTELSAENKRAVYIPKGFAHGFLTLEDETEVEYFMDEFYEEKLSKGVRWNDKAFKIKWPKAPKIISEKDKSYPDYKL